MRAAILRAGILVLASTAAAPSTPAPSFLFRFFSLEGRNHVNSFFGSFLSGFFNSLFRDGRLGDWRWGIGQWFLDVRRVVFLHFRHGPGYRFIWIKAGDGFADQPLHRVQELGILGGGEGQRPSRHSGPARAADPVHVVFGVDGHVVEKYVAQTLDIKAAGRHVTAHQDFHLVFLEFLQGLHAIGLLHISMQGQGIEAFAFQCFANRIHVAFTVAEDQGVLDRLGAQ